MIDDTPVDRRTVLGWLAIGAAALAGCSTGSNTRRGGSTTVPRSTGPAATTTVPSGPVQWSQLQSKLAGHLVLPSSPSYSTDLQSYDPRFDNSRPAAIAYRSNTSDVQHSIAFARQHDVPLAARSGGHSYAGYSTTSGLVIDVTSMNAVAVNGGTAMIGAGTRLIDVYTGLNNQGVSIPGGSCATVGIAGLALGGGIGVVARQHGMTCDAMTGVQVVTADSRVITADADHDDDLYWASRGGGGGNFGIATQFEFSTFPTGDVVLFTLRWPWSAASDVLPAWMAWLTDAPDALWSNCILGAGSPPSLQIGGIWLGSESGVSPYIDHLVSATGTAPSTRFLETIPLSHAMYVEAGCAELSQMACHLPGQTAQGQLTRAPSFAGSSYVDHPLSDAGVAAIVGNISERGAAGLPGAIAFDAYGGAINRVPADATAFVHRNSLCCAQYSITYNQSDSPAQVREHQAWVNQFGASIRPYVSGAAYQNYIDPTLANSLQAYYGTNLPRLQSIKQKWDPDDLFHFRQSIPLP